MSEQRERPEIGPPEDFEHFLHVGAGDISTGLLDRDQNSVFLEVVERRRRKLPRTPRRENSIADPARSGVSVKTKKCKKIFSQCIFSVHQNHAMMEKCYNLLQKKKRKEKKEREGKKERKKEKKKKKEGGGTRKRRE